MCVYIYVICSYDNRAHEQTGADLENDAVEVCYWAQVVSILSPVQSLFPRLGKTTRLDTQPERTQEGTGVLSLKSTGSECHCSNYVGYIGSSCCTPPNSQLNILENMAQGPIWMSEAPRCSHPSRALESVFPEEWKWPCNF